MKPIKTVETCGYAVDARLLKNGASYWDPAQSLPEEQWAEYVQVFNTVRVIARVKPTLAPPPVKNTFPPEINVVDLFDFHGILQALPKLIEVVAIMRRWVKQNEIVILKTPGIVPFLAWFWLRILRKFYAIEVRGDPGEVFHVIEHPLRPFLRVLFVTVQHAMCRHASAVLYVSNALAEAYPAPLQTPKFIVGAVRLDEKVFTPPRQFTHTPKPVKIVHVGNIEQIYKGHQFLLEAAAMVKEQGLPLQLTFVGEGRLRPRFEQQAARQGLAAETRFLGTVNWGTEIFNILDQANLFVFPSLTEGLGKALLEAMARGLPCIGSSVGGIPELLSPEDLVPPGDAHALAQKIREVVTDPARMTTMSARNLTKAREYHNDILRERRIEFLQHVKQTAEAWLNNQR